jgi:hypothetical protein
MSTHTATGLENKHARDAITALTKNIWTNGTMLNIIGEINNFFWSLGRDSIDVI